ncbi:hypothetical protein E4T49_07154 [Aureobasidium sp. EXF-10728]|nr:hypothetical protein E4T49_07154 [Aureobasidium sp. EXF-10728]
MRRDVVVVPPMDYVVIRFLADNPEVWDFHCHSKAIFVKAPLTLADKLSVPADHHATCKTAGVASTGNASGNTIDLLGLEGQNSPAPLVEYGVSTTKGYVAMAFLILSVICAWLG